MCKNHTSAKLLKKSNSKSLHERSYRSLLRKRRKLKTRLNCIKSINPHSPKIRKLEQTLQTVIESMKHLTFTKQAKEESKAISKIKTNPKFFYSYAKKRSKTKQNIAQLFDNHGNLTTDRKAIANILQNQFKSTFSDPNNPDIHLPLPTSPSLFSC